MLQCRVIFFGKAILACRSSEAGQSTLGPSGSCEENYSQGLCRYLEGFSMRYVLPGFTLIGRFIFASSTGSFVMGAEF